LLIFSGLQSRIDQSQYQQSHALYRQRLTLQRQELPVGVPSGKKVITDLPVEHHEVISHTPDNSIRSLPNVKSPPLPSRPQQLPLSPNPAPPQPIAFGDKNPFRNSDTTSAATTSASTNPFHQPIIHDLTQPDEDEDEELQRALAMSVDPVAEDPPGYDEGRPDRERSVRATAPPPSPTEQRGELVGQGDELSRAQSPYGPREEAATNTLALMPTSMDASHPQSISRSC